MVSKSRSGFTMVEMLVVVAIIGIISMMAINRYETMEAQGRQKEVQLEGAAFFTAERNYWASNGTFSACLIQVGYRPAAARPGKQFYSMGFSAPTAVAVNCGPVGAPQPCNTFDYRLVLPDLAALCAPGAEFASANLTAAANALVIPDQAALEAAVPMGTVTRNNIVIGFMGGIANRRAGGGNPVYDIWTMTMDSTLAGNRPAFLNIQSGL
ncbi:prepilin-type N-terminal cleavage/methylation domain-containing protein [bacterium]|nr:prepilin-type N-terminal cleavage/methylation domain-containing protein [bacterium]